MWQIHYWGVYNCLRNRVWFLANWGKLLAVFLDNNLRLENYVADCAFFIKIALMTRFTWTLLEHLDFCISLTIIENHSWWWIIDWFSVRLSDYRSVLMMPCAIRLWVLKTKRKALKFFEFWRLLYLVLDDCWENMFILFREKFYSHPFLNLENWLWAYRQCR